MKLAWTLLGLAALGLAAALAVMPWRLTGEARRAAIVAEISRDIGLDVRVRGPISLKLLPRPRMQVAEVAIRSPDGSIDLSAPALSGEFDMAALFGGRWRLVSATLSHPTGTIDIDRAGQSLSGSAAAPAPLRLSVRSGVFRLSSARLRGETIVTDLYGTLERGDRDAGLSASGAATWHGMPGQLTLRLGAPFGAAEERQSSVALRITSPAGSFSASGSLVIGAQPHFTGQVAASSVAPNRLLASLGLAPSWTGLQKFAIKGDAVARPGDLSLSEASLHINATDFEGTLGYHADRGRSLIEGTLATSRLDLADLAGRAIGPADLNTLYRTRIAPHLAEANLDLRVSASSVEVGDVTAQDVAFSLLCHDRSMEVTLDEALAFGGVVKARLLGALGPDDIEAHAELALSNVELGDLGVAASGQERITGTLSGKVAVAGRGRSLNEIVPTLAGSGEVAVQDGHFMGLSVSQALKRFTRRLPLGAEPSGQRTAFSSAASPLRIAGGVVEFVDGKVMGPGLSLAFAGHGDLPRGKIDIVALASPTNAAGEPIAGAPALPIEMRAAWGEPLMLMQQSRRLPLSGMPLTEFDAGELLP